MRGSGMTDRRWPVGWSLVVSSHSRHSVLSSLRPSFTHSIPSLRPYRGNRVTAGSEEPRKGRRTTDILHHIWSVSRLPPLRCAKRMSERMSVHLRPLMSYPFRVPRSRLRRFLVSLHSIAPRSGRDRSRSLRARARPAALGDGWGKETRKRREEWHAARPSSVPSFIGSSLRSSPLHSWTEWGTSDVNEKRRA